MNDYVSEFQWPKMEWPCKISKEFKLAFISGCIIGAITHLYAFSNLLLCNDAVNNAFSKNQHLASGRWSLGFLSSFSSNVQLQVVIGLISIIMIALTSGLTVKILELSHPGSVILTAALLVTFPTVACTFAYMYTADAYFTALFMNALAVYLTKKYKWGCVVAVILLALACGSYQAYFCFAIGLFVFDCILALLSHEKICAVLIRGGKYVLTLMMGLLLYLIVQKLLMNWQGVTLTTYEGIDTMRELSIRDRLTAIPQAYKIFKQFFMQWPYISPIFYITQWFAIILLLAFVLYLVISRKIYRDLPRVLLIIVGMFLIPLALNFVVVLAYTATIHRLMIYAYVLVFVFTVKCAELTVRQIILQGGRRWMISFGMGWICCAMIVWNNFCISNIGYHSLQLQYENSFALANRIMARIEILDGYTVGDPIAIVGSASSDFYGNANRYKDYSEILNTHMRISYLFVTKPFLEFYIGQHTSPLTTEQLEALKNSDEVINMPCYPAQGSVTMVDGIVVVKLGEGGIK